jgi:hypothetical protein
MSTVSEYSDEWYSDEYSDEDSGEYSDEYSEVSCTERNSELYHRAVFPGGVPHSSWTAPCAN